MDVVIVMIQSLRSQGHANVFPRTELDRFGLLIVDEAHNFAATTFSEGLNQLARRYMLGLSATPYRPDGRCLTFWDQ